MAVNGDQYAVARGSPPIRSSAATMIGSLSVEAPSNSAPAFHAAAAVGSVHVDADVGLDSRRPASERPVEPAVVSRPGRVRRASRAGARRRGSCGPPTVTAVSPAAACGTRTANRPREPG